MSRPPFNLAHVEEATRHGLMRGHRIMQTFRYSMDDDEHVEILLDIFDPPQSSYVLDAGCGVGEVSHLMARQRPDLSFLMVNISPYQLQFCPMGKHFGTRLGDFHELAVDTGTVDAVMFNSALVQMDERIALAQAYRVLRPGGLLMVNEPVRVSGDPGELEKRLACRTLTPVDLLVSIADAGFVVTASIWPEYTDTYFRQLLALDGLEHLLDGIRPLIVKARKPKGEDDAQEPST